MIPTRVRREIGGVGDDRAIESVDVIREFGERAAIRGVPSADRTLMGSGWRSVRHGDRSSGRNHRRWDRLYCGGGR